MSTPIIVIIALTVVLTVAAFGALIWSVVRSMSAIAADVARLRDRVLPDLVQIQRDAAVASRELEQVSASLEGLQQQRDSRRGRRPG